MPKPEKANLSEAITSEPEDLVVSRRDFPLYLAGVLYTLRQLASGHYETLVPSLEVNTDQEKVARLIAKFNHEFSGIWNIDPDRVPYGEVEDESVSESSSAEISFEQMACVYGYAKRLYERTGVKDRITTNGATAVVLTNGSFVTETGWIAMGSMALGGYEDTMTTGINNDLIGLDDIFVHELAHEMDYEWWQTANYDPESVTTQIGVGSLFWEVEKFWYL